MRVIRSLERARGQFRRPVVTVGNFDGVHRGHQFILRRVREDADLHGGAAVALTFEPHPVTVLRPDAAPRLLMPLGDRLAGLASCGMDATVVQRFTRDFAQVEAEEFVSRFLVEVLDAQKLVVGHDLNFGRNRAGSVETLVADGARHGFAVEVIRPVHVGSLVVHSSEIRRAVAAGDVALAMRLLGRPHVVRGRVTRGAGRGRGLGFPTANVRPKTQAVPPDGVYVTRATTGKRRTGSVTSIGNAPTFGGSATVIEAHLFSDPGDLFGKPIAIEFLERLRDQQRFASSEALQRQVQADIERARAILDRAY